MLSRDFRDILSAFSDAGVEYLLVGAYALAAHGLVRGTGDIDLWVRPTSENAARVHRALLAFGAPAGQISVEDFTKPDSVVQLGVPPIRIDILTAISGVEFPGAWEARTVVVLDGVEVPVLSRTYLVANKRAADRPKDRLDLRWLEEGRDTGE
jgi:hypothetical protein